MGKYLEELFEIYLRLKDKEKFDKHADELVCYEKASSNECSMPCIESKEYKIAEEVLRFKVRNEEETGKIYEIDNFLFLSIKKEEDFYTGYKVSEWVDFATDKDFIFEFNGDKFMAIMEKISIPIEKIGEYISTIDKKYIKILKDYEFKGKKIPEKYTGLTVPEGAIQYKFREIELEEVRDFLMNKILTKKELSEKISAILNKIDFPAATKTEKIIKRKEGFIVNFDRDRQKLIIYLTDEKLKNKRIAKIKFFNEIFLFYVEDKIIEADVLREDIDITFIAKNIEIINE